jgi:hypothetical protein
MTSVVSPWHAVPLHGLHTLPMAGAASPWPTLPAHGRWPPVHGRRRIPMAGGPQSMVDVPSLCPVCRLPNPHGQCALPMAVVPFSYRHNILCHGRRQAVAAPAARSMPLCLPWSRECCGAGRRRLPWFHLEEEEAAQGERAVVEVAVEPTSPSAPTRPPPRARVRRPDRGKRGAEGRRRVDPTTVVCALPPQARPPLSVLTCGDCHDRGRVPRRNKDEEEEDSKGILIISRFGPRWHE